MNEHRRSPRKTAHVMIHVTNAMTGESMGHVGNLSSDGMLLVCNRKILDDALFQLSFELVDAEGAVRTIEIGVHEQWSEAANVPGHYWVGFQFIDVAPDDIATIASWLGDNND